MLTTSTLGDLFTTIAAKYLSDVDADPKKSHGHEVGGLSSLRKCWGEVPGGKHIPAQYIFLGDEESLISESGSITWYDSRRLDPNRGPEWRMYYYDNAVVRLMKPGDFLVVGQKKNGEAVFFVAPRGSDGETSLRNLFAILDIRTTGIALVNPRLFSNELDFRARFILESLGIEFERYDDSVLEAVLKKFGADFPSTIKFSQFAREHSGLKVGDLSIDDVLLGWYEHEDLLFRTLERHLANETIRKGFNDIDIFIEYALSIINRRKARAGCALENHVSALFDHLGIKYSLRKKTEKNNKPDFIFPSIRHYHDNNFPVEWLSMLASKASCKDRWRQILTEADRIETKYLLTLQPAISLNQTEEMIDRKIQLVLPASIHSTFAPEQQGWLWTVERFCNVMLELQSRRHASPLVGGE